MANPSTQPLSRHPAPGAAGAPEVQEVVRLESVRKVHGGPKNEVVALDDVTIGLDRGPSPR